MTVTCCIRYRIDPCRGADFEAYARAWLEIIPAAGGDLIGYYLPHEGDNATALALIGFPTLSAYEAYRARLRADPAAQANFAFAQKEGFIQREQRTFLRKVDAPG